MDSNTPQDYKNLPGLAQRRLEKLAEIGLSSPSNPPEAAGDSAIRTQLVGGRVGWLQLNAGERELGYKGVRVFERPFQTDIAILSALSILEARLINPEGTNLERVWSAARLRVAAGRAGVEILPGDPGWQQAVRNDPRLRGGGFKTRDIPNAMKLAYHEACLRHYRPDFDALSDEDQAALLVHAYKHAKHQLETARASQAFFEYGSPDGLPKHKGADPERDIRAAELKDALGLEHHEIGEILGVPVPKDYYGTENTIATYDHQGMRRMIDRGQKRLKRELGEEGYERHIEAIKADLERWHSLGDDQDIAWLAEQVAEQQEIPPEKALEIVLRELEEYFGED